MSINMVPFFMFCQAVNISLQNTFCSKVSLNDCLVDINSITPTVKEWLLHKKSNSHYKKDNVLFILGKSDGKSSTFVPLKVLIIFRGKYVICMSYFHSGLCDQVDE